MGGFRFAALKFLVALGVLGSARTKRMCFWQKVTAIICGTSLSSLVLRSPRSHRFPISNLQERTLQAHGKRRNAKRKRATYKTDTTEQRVTTAGSTTAGLNEYGTFFPLFPQILGFHFPLSLTTVHFIMSPLGAYLEIKIIKVSVCSGKGDA